MKAELYTKLNFDMKYQEFYEFMLQTTLFYIVRLDTVFFYILFILFILDNVLF